MKNLFFILNYGTNLHVRYLFAEKYRSIPLQVSRNQEFAHKNAKPTNFAILLEEFFNQHIQMEIKIVEDNISDQKFSIGLSVNLGAIPNYEEIAKAEYLKNIKTLQVFSKKNDALMLDDKIDKIPIEFNFHKYKIVTVDLLFYDENFVFQIMLDKNNVFTRRINLREQNKLILNFEQNNNIVIKKLRYRNINKLYFDKF